MSAKQNIKREDNQTADSSQNIDMPTARRPNLLMLSDLARNDSASNDMQIAMNDLVADLCLNGPSHVDKLQLSTQNTASCANNSGSSTATTSSFSFKHFLSNSSAVSAPSTTVTSLDPVSSSTADGDTVEASTTADTATTMGSTSALNPAPIQNSTGARPKVPQADPNTASANSSAASKMKRSPRFSSFDSQASLTEYVTVGMGQSPIAKHNMIADGFPDIDVARNFETNCDQRETRNDGFPSLLSSLPIPTDPRYVPRSYSSYDVLPSVRRRSSACDSTHGNKSNRPSRLTFSSANSNKLKLEFPLGAAGCSKPDTHCPVSSSDASNFATQPAQAAAALPDFVQDHWQEAWYAQEAQLNSPQRRRSPNATLQFIPEFGNAASLLLNRLDSGNVHSNSSASRNSTANDEENAAPNVAGSTNKMLPDFLSDGPIIHSSQRLADVTVGLPTSSARSPRHVEAPVDAVAQNSALVSENERMQHELNEVRSQMEAQQRLANELEQRLLERFARQQEEATSKLRQKIDELNAEVAKLRNQNETLREDGAVGGCNKPTSTTTGKSNVTSSSSSRPQSCSNTNQRMSRELRQAAASAENHLRQLLAGVENLRHMAASIDGDDSNIGSDE